MHIGLFSLKDGIGCTSLSIHVANFLASNENNKVAIKELCKEGKYKTAKADFADDNTFFINDVHFYPYDVNITPTETFIVDDIGKIGVLYKFNEFYDKLYFCTDGSDEDLSNLLEYKHEVCDITPDILLFGGSKECIHKWQNEGFKVVLIGKAREKRIPQNFAMVLSTFLRTKGITPPIYHADSVFAPVIFGTESMLNVEDTPVVAKKPEPKTPGAKMFVKVPAPTDTYKEPRVVHDDGLGITRTHTTVTQNLEESVDNEHELDKEHNEDKKRVIKDTDEFNDSGKKVSKPLFSPISLKNPFHKKNSNNEEEVDDEDDEHTSSMLGEIPMQGVDFSFETQISLKDLSSYSLFINKHFTCIGLNSNVRKRHYDNMDGTLLHLTKINKEILQFMTEDLLSGDYVLARFSQSEIASMRVYFDFMCNLFKREIGKTATLREYVEFKQYYNRLCETKIMLDAEENERIRIIHDIYLRYTPYAELYNMNIITEQSLIDGVTDPFIEDLTFILNEHICDEDVKDVIKGLIDEIIALKPVVATEAVLEPTETEVSEDDDNKSDVDISDIVKMPYKIRIICLNDDGSVEDNATYGLVNIERAVFTYMQKACFMKKLLLINEDNVSTPLFSSKNGGIIIPAKGDFDENVIKIKDRIEYIMSTF